MSSLLLIFILVWRACALRIGSCPDPISHEPHFTLRCCIALRC